MVLFINNKIKAFQKRLKEILKAIRTPPLGFGYNEIKV